MIDTNRDYLVNRAGDDLLNPRRHAFEHGSHPYYDDRCARCHQPRHKHRGLLRRCWAALGRAARGLLGGGR